MAPWKRSGKVRFTPISCARMPGNMMGWSCASRILGMKRELSRRSKDAGVPILIQAYPDELGKMAPEQRRDAFCGKFSIMDVFCQYGLPFTALKPHTVHPGSPRFAANIDYFDRLCRVVKGMKSMVVGAIGARTTAFKTVRIDELALQRHGITMETLDLSDVFARMSALRATDAKLVAKAERLKRYTSWTGVPEARSRDSGEAGRSSRHPHRRVRLAGVGHPLLGRDAKATSYFALRSAERDERSRRCRGLRSGRWQCRGHVRSEPGFRQGCGLPGLEQ